MSLSLQLLEVSIQKFRRIQEPLHLNLTHPSGAPLRRAVIAGPNGAGKTSVLEAILLALGLEDLIVRDLPAAERGDHWRVEIPPGGEIELQCRMVAGQLAFFPPLDLKTNRFTVRRTAAEWKILWRGEDGKVDSRQDPLQMRSLLKELAVEYFSSWRAPILPGGMQPSAKGRPLQDNEANRLRRLKQRIINERARRAFDGTGKPHDELWLARLNAVWSVFHHDGSRLEPGTVVSGDDEPLFDLFVLEKDGTRRCSVDQLSSGEIELLSMAGTLILVGGFQGLLLIDEPELHLHREWQGQLMDVLAAMAPQAQVVVATHADAPWDQVYSFERFFLARPGDPRSLGKPAAPPRSDG